MFVCLQPNVPGKTEYLICICIWVTLKTAVQSCQCFPLLQTNNMCHMIASTDNIFGTRYRRFAVNPQLVVTVLHRNYLVITMNYLVSTIKLIGKWVWIHQLGISGKITIYFFQKKALFKIYTTVTHTQEKWPVWHEMVFLLLFFYPLHYVFMFRVHIKITTAGSPSYSTFNLN